MVLLAENQEFRKLNAHQMMTVPRANTNMAGNLFRKGVLCKTCQRKRTIPQDSRSKAGSTTMWLLSATMRQKMVQMIHFSVEVNPLWFSGSWSVMEYGEVRLGHRDIVRVECHPAQVGLHCNVSNKNGLFIFNKPWRFTCRGPDLNRHGHFSNRGILSPLRLPVPPPRLFEKQNANSKKKKAKSAKHLRGMLNEQT